VCVSARGQRGGRGTNQLNCFCCKQGALRVH
jgi:hypothetical protein